MIIKNLNSITNPKQEKIMKKKNMLLTLGCLTACLCAGGSLFASNKTPGEKLDKAIETAKETAQDAKDAAEEVVKDVKDAAKNAKEVAKEKCDKARENLANKIKPS